MEGDKMVLGAFVVRGSGWEEGKLECGLGVNGLHRRSLLKELPRGVNSIR